MLVNENNNIKIIALDQGKEVLSPRVITDIKADYIYGYWQ